jgi:hypothetical protein
MRRLFKEATKIIRRLRSFRNVLGAQMYIGVVKSTVSGLLFRFLTRPLLWAFGAALFCVCCTETDSNRHRITVTFDYDFTENHACSPTVTTNCLVRFNVYDISGTTPIKLFSIPAPSGADGRVTNITGSIRPLPSKLAKHVFAVSAQMASGTESSPQACAASVTP